MASEVSDLLARLYRLLLDHSRDHIARLDEDGIADDDPAAQITSIPGEIEQLGEEIRSRLPGSDFDTGREVADAAMTRLAALASRSPEEALSADWLYAPSLKMKFKVPISLPSDLLFALEIGGPACLAVAPRDLSGERRSRLILSGELRAITTNRAIEIIERHMKAFIALSVASGIARVDVTRQPPAEVSIDWLLGSESYPLDPRVGAIAGGIFFVPWIAMQPVTHIREGQIINGPEGALTPILKRIKSVVATEQPQSLHSAALLFADAIGSPNSGQSTAFALMALEAALLRRKDKSDTMARLKEAVAYRLGTSEDRDTYRKRVNDLYEVRSAYVHGGSVTTKFESRSEALSLTSDVLSRELREVSLS